MPGRASRLISWFPAAEVRNAETRAAEERLDGSHLRAFMWTLFVFKLITVVVIFWIAGGSFESGILLWATNWPWLIIPAIAIVGWLTFHLRLRRVRARRLELQRSEWMLAEHETMRASTGAREFES